jgi:EmrB/QacA subfamily drug resistance transporter
MLSTRRPTRPGLVLGLVSGAQFMVILDLAIVNVALPSIQADLGASRSGLQWVVIAYGLTLGGFLLLGGRMADLLGRRAVLVSGLGVFAAASLGAGLSGSLGWLIAFRALQGLGGALASPAALSIVTSTFREGAARNKALGICGAVGGSAASIGVIAGGALTSGPGWHWVFLMNVPVGLALVAAILRWVPAHPAVERGPTDVLGAVTVTGGLMAIVYAVNHSAESGWTSGATLGAFAAGLALLGLFVLVESRVRSPLMPLAILRLRTLTAANVVAVLLWGAFFATIFQGTLFMGQVLGYSAIDTGLAWLAATASSLVVAGGVAPRLVSRLGAGTTLVIGQAIMALGLLWGSRAPVDAAYWSDLFPGFLAMGVGIGFSGMAVQVGAFIGVRESVSGLAGGLVETAREVGGAVGVAVVATMAIARTDDVLATGGSQAVALTEGYQRAMLVAAAVSAAASVAAGLLLRPAERAVATPPDPAMAPATDTPAGPAVDTPVGASVGAPVTSAVSSRPTGADAGEPAGTDAAPAPQGATP